MKVFEAPTHLQLPLFSVPVMQWSCRHSFLLMSTFTKKCGCCHIEFFWLLYFCGFIDQVYQRKIKNSRFWTSYSKVLMKEDQHDSWQLAFAENVRTDSLHVSAQAMLPLSVNKSKFIKTVNTCYSTLCAYSPNHQRICFLQIAKNLVDPAFCCPSLVVCVPTAT